MFPSVFGEHVNIADSIVIEDTNNKSNSGNNGSVIKNL